MIARRGSSTRIPRTRPHVELAGVARASDAARRTSRSSCSGTRSPCHRRHNPRPTARRRVDPAVLSAFEHAAARGSAPVATGVAQTLLGWHGVGARSAVARCDSSADDSPGPQPPHPAAAPALVLQMAERIPPGATGASRASSLDSAPGRRLHRLANLDDRRPRPRPETVRPDLATVPRRAGPCDPRGRLRPRRHRPAPPLIRTRGDRARSPSRAPRRDHLPPYRGLGNPAGPQPAHGPRRPRRSVSVLDPRPRCQVHRRLRRRVLRRRHPHHPHPSPGTARERDRGTLDRYPAPRMPRPHADHRTAPPRGGAARVPRSLQHAPSAPIATSVFACRAHSPALRSDRSAATTRPARWPGTRVSAGRMT